MRCLRLLFQEVVIFRLRRRSEQTAVHLPSRINFRRQERNEQIQVKDAERICDDVESLQNGFDNREAHKTSGQGFKPRHKRCVECREMQ